jgi:hypothetical protein
MLDHKTRVTPLESRKQLLIAESEINRAQLRQEWETISGKINFLAYPTKSLGAFASLAAMLMDGFKMFRRGKSIRAARNGSNLDIALKSARLACSIGLFVNARNKASE